MAAPMTADAPGRPLTLYLVRHGETIGAAGRCIGHCDLALSPHGRADLTQLGAAWRAPRPERIVASDLNRARESAAELAEAWGLRAPVATDARLREMSFGAWDGRPWGEIEQADGPALASWMAGWEEAATPGGEGFGDVVVRAGAWLADLVRQARAEHVERVVAVAHAGSIRAVLVHTVGLPRALAFRLRLDHARVSALRLMAGEAPDASMSAEVLFLNADRIPANHDC